MDNVQFSNKAWQSSLGASSSEEDVRSSHTRKSQSNETDPFRTYPAATDQFSHSTGTDKKNPSSSTNNSTPQAGQKKASPYPTTDSAKGGMKGMFDTFNKMVSKGIPGVSGIAQFMDKIKNRLRNCNYRQSGGSCATNTALNIANLFSKHKITERQLFRYARSHGIPIPTPVNKLSQIIKHFSGVNTKSGNLNMDGVKNVLKKYKGAVGLMIRSNALWRGTNAGGFDHEVAVAGYKDGKYLLVDSSGNDAGRGAHWITAKRLALAMGGSKHNCYATWTTSDPKKFLT